MMVLLTLTASINFTKMYMCYYKVYTGNLNSEKNPSFIS